MEGLHLFSMETFSLSMETFPPYRDFTGTLRGLFSMETFSLSMETFSLSVETFPPYGDFTGTLLYGDFFSIETFSLSMETFSLSMETFPLYGDFTGTLRGLYGDSSLWRLFLSTGKLYGMYCEQFPDVYGKALRHVL